MKKAIASAAFMVVGMAPASADAHVMITSPAPMMTLATTAPSPGSDPEPTLDEAAAGSGGQPGIDPATAASGDDSGDGGAGVGTFAIVALAAAFLTTMVVILRARRNAG